MRILSFIFLLAALSFSSFLSAQPAAPYASSEVIVKLADLREVTDRNRNVPTSTGLAKLDALCRQFGPFEVRNLLGEAPKPTVKKRNRPATDRLIVLRFATAIDVDKLVQKLAQSTLVAYAEPNYVGKHASSTSANFQVDELIPNDYSSTVWWAKNDGSFGGYPSEAPNPVVDADIDATDAWEITTGSSSVTMAVLDSGIDPTNTEFSGRIVTGYDFVNNDNNPIDDHAHGTNVTGLATMKGNNNFGLVGVDWQCKIMPVKVLDDDNLGFYTDFAAGVIYAVDNGADVINMSLGGSGVSQTLLDAVQYAYANDVVVVAAMMNDDSNVRRYPAAYSEVISVGATDLNDFRVRGAYTGGSWGSNYGDHIDVVAPGNSMLSTRYNDNQAFNWWMGGTSQATPLVAGTASLLLGLNPNLSVEEVRTIIRTTADDQVGAASEDTPGFDIYHGAGRLNTHQAVLMASCPPGATCNDGNGNTYNDVYGVNCQCQGTPFSVRLNVNKSEVCAGETAQLQVTTSGLPNAAYRWQWSANGTTWNESSTDPNAPVWNLNVGNLSNDPRWWRVLVTSNGFTTTSHPVKTTVLRAPNISVTNASITSGQSATLTATGYDANGGCFDLTDYIGAIDQRGGLARNGTGVSFNSIRYAGGGFGTNYWDMTVSNAAANHYIDYNYEIPDQDFRNFKTITVGLSYGGNPGFQLFIRDRQQGYTNLGTATGAGGTFDLPSDLARKDDVHLIKIRFRTSDLGGNGTSRRFHLSNIRLCGADFRWSNGATTPSITVSPSSTTNYTATASYGDCSTAQTATVTVATPNQQSRYPAQTANIPGTIQAEYYDLGGQGIAFNDNNTKNGDQNFRSGDNVDCNILSGSNYKVGWTANGEWLEYTVNAQAGTYDIIVAATSGSGGSVGDVRVSLDGMVLGTANIVNTGGWTSPQNFTIPNVNVSGGSNKVLRLTVVNGQGLDIDKVTFTPSGPSCTPGTSCNDGDACTVNDVYDNNCGCSGTFQDSDNDGVCNANDQCPGFDNDLIGTACNDGNPNTINDTYNNSCDCVGQPVSGQTTFWLEAECGNVGSAWTLLNDGGASGGQALTFLGASSTGSAPTAASARIRFNVNISQAGSYEIYTRSIAPNSGDDSYWVRVNNGSWVRFNQVNAPNQNNSWQWDQVGQWNGGANNNPLSFNLPTGNATIDFAYRENGIKFDKVFISLDQSPSGLGATVENCTLSCTPGTACNDGNPCTINDVYDNSCGCSGTFQDSDGDGVCNANDDCPGFNDNLIGTACNDGNPDTDNDVYTADCVCAGTPVSAGGTLTLDAIHDAYLQGSSRYNTTELRVENGNRVSYLMFDISGATGPITSAQLVMEVGSDGGNGVITVHKGSSNNWTETNISNANKPSPIQQLGNLNTSYSGSNTYTWNLTPGAFSGNTVSLIVRHDSGNDVSFKSSENTDVAGRPQLVLEYGNALTTPDNDGSFRAAVLSSEKELRVFPNPFQDELTSRFTASEQTRELFLLDVNGRVLERQVILPGQTQARFTGNEHRLIPSLYLIRLLSPDGSTSRKVMKLR